MKDLLNGLPRIINAKTNFSCFGGFAKGSIELSVYDNGTNQFPAIATVESNLGSGSISLTLTGNQTINQSVSGVSVQVVISNWNCTVQQLSMHVKAVAKKSIFSCTVFDQTLSGQRHNQSMHEAQIAELINKAEMMNA